MNISYCKKVKITMIRTISGVNINGAEIDLNFEGKCSFLAVKK